MANINHAYVICSDCFTDEGLRLMAVQLGNIDACECINCGRTSGQKLDIESVNKLAFRFFVNGTQQRLEYGAYPLVAANLHQATNISVGAWTSRDLSLIESVTGLGFFRYTPRLWMVGQNEPLQRLRKRKTRPEELQKIISTYPTLTISRDHRFYRIRKAPSNPSLNEEYDSPPDSLLGKGRLDSRGFPILYGSSDIEVCIHECRITVEDEAYVACLAPTLELKLLDLTCLLYEEDKSEFECIDIAIHMLFLAGEKSYPIARELALAAHEAGFDGLLYPSYFSLIRTGSVPLETVLGLSCRIIPAFHHHEESKIVPNIALFGRPISDEKITILSLNRVIMRSATYGIEFGPVGIGLPDFLS